MVFQVAWLGLRLRSALTEQVSPGCEHGELEADFAHIDVGHPGVEALIMELLAALPNPAGGLAELLP